MHKRRISATAPKDKSVERTRYRPRRISTIARNSSHVPRRTRKVARVYNRRNYTHIPKIIRDRWSNPLAASKSVKFKYADIGFDLSTTTVDVGHYVFRGNGPYDPDSTGVGVQPYGWDDLMKNSLYYWYKVVACKVKFKIYKTGNTDQVTISVLPSTSSTLSYTSIDDLLAYGRCSQRRITNEKPMTTITRYITTNDMVKSRTNIGDADLAGTYTSLPIIQWFWHIFSDSTIVMQNVQIYFDVEITYYTRVLRLDTANES